MGDRSQLGALASDTNGKGVYSTLDDRISKPVKAGLKDKKSNANSSQAQLKDTSLLSKPLPNNSPSPPSSLNAPSPMRYSDVDANLERSLMPKEGLGDYSPAILGKGAGRQVEAKVTHPAKRTNHHLSPDGKDGRLRGYPKQNAGSIDRHNLRELARQLLSPEQSASVAELQRQPHSSSDPKKSPLVIPNRINYTHHSRKHDNLGQSSSLHTLGPSEPSDSPSPPYLHQPGLDCKRGSLPALDQPATTYKQYTLREYRELKPHKYYMLGGLGANLGTNEWESKRSQREKMHQFAHEVNLTNISRLLASSNRPTMSGKHQLPEVEKAHELKRRMLDYASHVPRPKLARIYEREELEEMQQLAIEPLNELARLEQQHSQLLQRLEPFKAQTN